MREMDNDAASAKLADLLTLPAESEVLEFKEGKADFDSNKLGRYFSALANEANLRGKSEAWLVMGVADNRRIVGTSIYAGRKRREELKHSIANHTTDRATFSDIFEISHPDGRVLLFRIPPAPRGVPVAFLGHYYGREGESLGALGHEKEMRIRAQATAEDWSAGLVPDATLDAFDPDALRLARRLFKTRNPHLEADCDGWTDAVFLDKAKLTRKGVVTRAALILLGKEESAHFLSPSNPQISWILRDHTDRNIDFAHFGPPFLLSTQKVCGKIRIIKYRYLQSGSLFPEEVDTYDSFIIREAIHNCVAHQDYALSGRINVIECTDRLVFSNRGGFMPGSVEKVIESNAPEERYRNALLANAMVGLNMVETIGSGISRMFDLQRKRFFPLPDYDLSESDRVVLSIIGRVLDPDYALVLASNVGLSLSDIMLLDKVQKRRTLTKEEARHLRLKRLIEGRYPNCFLAKSVAQVTGRKAAYSKNKGLDKRFYQETICAAAREHNGVDRRTIDDLLWEKLPAGLTEQQRKNRISNIISEMRRNGMIHRQGPNGRHVWVCAPPTLTENP